MVKIFVSYSHEDNKNTLVKRLDYFLELIYGDGNVWYDENMRGGKEWWEQIIGEIEKCDIFLYLLSENSDASQYCQDEINEANKFKKPIIVMQIDKSFSLPDKWKSYQCDRLYDEQNDISLEGFSRLNGAIVDTLHLQIPSALTEAQYQADLKVLEKLWPFISGEHMDDLLTRIDFSFVDIPTDLLDITIRSFMSLRQLPAYQFNNKPLQNSFESLDRYIAIFDSLIKATHHYVREDKVFEANHNLSADEARNGFAIIHATRKMIIETSMKIRTEIPEFIFPIE